MEFSPDNMSRQKKNGKYVAAPASEESAPAMKPITPEMRNIMQSLANNMDAARQNLAEREKQFSDYIAQCANLLGLKPEEFDGFNIQHGAFVLKAPAEDVVR